MSFRSKVLIFFQFCCLAFLAITLDKPVVGIILFFQILGFCLSLWSVLVMKMGNFNIQPEVKTGATLTKKGPYKRIRNPMYTGLLIFFAAGMFSEFKWSEVLVYLLLVIVLLFKIHYEEHYLTLHFGKSYEAYKSETYRLIPFIY